MKILNLYAGLGGNRKGFGNNHEITAVEMEQKIADVYKANFPNDKVVVGDANQYLLDHSDEFDFIWTSPPCPTHSKSRFARRDTTTPAFPDLKLYEEIIFLKHNFKGKYVVENVIPYYEPLIPAKKRGRHLYWTNFNLPNNLNERKGGIMEGKNEMNRWCEFHNIDLSSYKGTQRKDKIARNLVDYEAGKTILETVLGIYKSNNTNQTELF